MSIQTDFLLTENPADADKSKADDKTKGKDNLKKDKGTSNIEKPSNDNLNNNDILTSIVHMVYYSLGARVYGIHEAFMMCGVWSAVVITVLLGSLICERTITLIRVSQYVEDCNLTYSSLAETILKKSPWKCARKCAKHFRFLIDFTVTFYLFLACSNMTIIMGRNLKALTEGVSHFEGDGTPSLDVYILSLMVPCSAVSFFTNLKLLAPFCVASICFTVVITLTNIIFGSTYRSVNLQNIAPYNSVIETIQYVGFAIFCLDAVTVALPVKNNMTQPQKFPQVAISSMTIIVSTLILNGFFGYWAFNKHSVNPITVNLPFNSISITLKAYLCLILLAQYSISISIANSTVGNLGHFFQILDSPSSDICCWKRLYGVLKVFLVTVTAFAIASCRSLMIFLGCTCVSCLVLIYPSVLEICVCKQYTGFGKHRWRLWKCLLLIVSGIYMFIFGVYFMVHRVIL